MRKRIAAQISALALTAGAGALPAAAYELTEAFGFVLTGLDADAVCATTDVAFILTDDSVGVVHFYEICNGFLVVQDDRVYELGWPDLLALQDSMEQVEILVDCAVEEGWGAVLLREPDGNLIEKQMPCWRFY